MVRKEPFYYGHFLLSPIWPLWRGSTVDFPILKVDKGVYKRKLALAYQGDLLISYCVYMMTASFHISLFEGTINVDKRHMRFKIANITLALPVPVYQQTDFTMKDVVIWHLHDTVVWFRTRVNLRWGDSRWHDILWRYHVNKCRAMRRNRSELTLARKLPPVSCKHLLRHSC